MILGGLSENLSLVVGFNHLLCVAIAFYLLSWALEPEAPSPCPRGVTNDARETEPGQGWQPEKNERSPASVCIDDEPGSRRTGMGGELTDRA